MAQFTDGSGFLTGPELRALLSGWLAAESEPQTRLQALHTAAQVARLAEEMLTQRVMEARSFNRSWSQIAAAVGVTKQSANRRWRSLDAGAEALAAQREREYKARRVAMPAAPPPRPDLPGLEPQAASWWAPPGGGALPLAVPSVEAPTDDGWNEDWGEVCGCDDDP